MKFGIGSTNKTKIEACENAINKIIDVFNISINSPIVYFPRETVTSVPDMPLDRDELIDGARERALFVYNSFLKEGITVDYAIGLEGGVYTIPQNKQTELTAFLENWVYVYNGTSGFYGSSPSLPLPAQIQHDLYKEGIELADVIDQFSGKNDVRSNEGAFGILTHNLLNRNQSFESAIINALIPFFNKKYNIQEPDNENI